MHIAVSMREVELVPRVVAHLDDEQRRKDIAAKTMATAATLLG